jgi:hypothetical protein
MARLIELVLFFAPIGLYVAWLLLGRAVSTSATVALIVFLLLVAGGSVWYGIERSMPPDDTYVPAHMENGRIVEGHGVKR